MYSDLCPLLFRKNWPARGLADSIASVNVDQLAVEYGKLRENAPRRGDRDKRYFVGHTGIPSSETSSTRREEHFAMALRNLKCRWPRRDGGWHFFLDYQVPLKAKRADRGIGKIDLFGLTDRGRVLVVELKYSTGSRGDSPLHALMEGLRYAAIVEANLCPIAAEIRGNFRCKRVDAVAPPIVHLLGPIPWWRSWFETAAAGNWAPAFARLAVEVEKRIRVTVECMATGDSDLLLGGNGRPPSLNRVPALHFVRLDRDPPRYERLS